MPNTTLRQRFTFSSTQKKVLFALASMVGLRMLGLFLVLPVFTLYGLRFTSSKFLVGFAFGAYALTMAILQIPLGRLSDRIGRRKVLVLGMTLFSVGSFLCALPALFPHSWQIWELIFGRLVQGGGAIISVAFATVAKATEMIAPPPCTSRPIISSQICQERGNRGGKAQRNDPTLNSVMPSTSTLRRPMRSDSLPRGICRIAMVSA